MKRLVLTLLLVGGTAAAQLPTYHQPACELKMVKGTYVATYLGWLAVPIPDAAPATIPGVIMGVLSVSPTGGITGNVTVITPSGKTVYESTEGSLVEIAPDCTGTMTIYSRTKGSTDPPAREIDRFVYLRETGEFVVLIDELEWGIVPISLGSWKRLDSWPNQATW